MSERVELLYEELSDIFGPGFGAIAEATGSLTEDVDAYLAERMDHRRGKGGGAPSSKGNVRGKGGDFPGEKKKGKSKGRAGRSIHAIAKATAKKHAGKEKAREAEGQKHIDAFRAKMHGGKKSSASASGSSKRSSAGASGGGSGDSKEMQKKGAGGKSRGGADSHFPFKRSPNLGPGPRKRHHDERKCWDCNCPGNIYSSGCNCTSRGGKNCTYEKGYVKHISYSKSWKSKYNPEYRAWRKSKGGEVTARLGSTRGSV